MRLLVIALVLSLSATAIAQDASMEMQQQSMQATQQAIQLNQQATQQAIQFNQQATQQAMEQSQQAAQQSMQASQLAAQIDTPGYAMAAKPKFSVKAGTYPASITLRLKDSTRGAAIYYTIDGWTPTASSHRYIGPIVITGTTTLQAIAIAPGCTRSSIASVTYTLPGNPSVAGVPTAHSLVPGGVPPKRDISVPLVFTAAVTTAGAQIGDKLPIALAKDLTVGGTVLASRSTPVLATITQVERPGIGGAPGVLTFSAWSITIDGKTVPLSGSETREGETRIKAVHTLFLLIPFAGASGVLIHGKDAEIPQGATFTAHLYRNALTASAQ